MKVVCIDASRGKTTGEIPNFKEGQIVNANQSSGSVNAYDISEHLFSSKKKILISWAKTRFIPLSDKDEQAILFHRLEDQVVANLCEELGDERNFIGEDDYH